MYDGREETLRFGTTDWAAQQFLRMLDREERQKAKFGRLRTAEWRPDVPQQQANGRDDVVFGDSRDAVADLVQRDIYRRGSCRTRHVDGQGWMSRNRGRRHYPFHQQSPSMTLQARSHSRHANQSRFRRGIKTSEPIGSLMKS
jgi:hypothetical protein